MFAKTFKTMDDALAEVRRTQSFLDSGVVDFHRALKPGDFAYTIWVPGYEGNFSDFDLTPENLAAHGALAIYYQILESTREPDEPPLPANRREVMGYSSACPEGEYGTIHIATIWDVIAADAFEKARHDGWPLFIPERVTKFCAARRQAMGQTDA